MSAVGVASRTFPSRMLRKAIVLALAMTGPVAVVAGCAAPPPRVDARARDRVALSAELLDIADLGASRFQSMFLKYATSNTPRDQVARLALVRNEAVANMRTIALGNDPGRDLIDMYVWSRVATHVCHHRNVVLANLIPDICGETYEPIRLRVQQVAKEWIAPDRLARIDLAIDTFLDKHPDMMTAALFRMVDLKERLDPAVQPTEVFQPDDSMFSPVTDAARQLEQTRITAQQMLWMLARMPTAAGWEAQAEVALALTSEEVKALQADMSALERHVGELSSSVDALGSTLGGDAGLRGVMREAFERGGLVMFGLVVAGTVGALLVVRAARRRD